MCNAAFKEGERHRAIVFLASCPGEHEHIDRRPLSERGKAGKSARELADVLHQLRKDEWPSATLDDYTLINSHPEPRFHGFKGLNRDVDEMEPSIEQVLAPENIARLHEELARVECSRLVCLGNPAHWCAIALRLISWPGLTLEPEIIRFPHPSNPNKPPGGSRHNRRLNWEAHANAHYNGGG